MEQRWKVECWRGTGEAMGGVNGRSGRDVATSGSRKVRNSQCRLTEPQALHVLLSLVMLAPHLGQALCGDILKLWSR